MHLLTTIKHIPYLQGAEPFFYPGGEIGCLCLHGFTASPAEVRWLGMYLHNCGFTIYGARLAGHGTDPHDLARTRWQDWYTSALDGYSLLRQMCKHVFLVGHSMGGLLALLLSTDVEVEGVAVLATPVRFKSRVMANARWIKYALPYTDQTDRTTLPDMLRQEQTKRGEAVLGRVRYDLWSSAGVAELYALAGYVDSQLPQVNVPLLLIYSHGDQTAAVAQGDYIATRVSSRIIERQTLEHSGHILTQDIERDQVFAWVGEFIQRIVNTTNS
jgi:carboxylesterase